MKIDMASFEKMLAEKPWKSGRLAEQLYRGQSGSREEAELLNRIMLAVNRKRAVAGGLSGGEKKANLLGSSNVVGKLAPLVEKGMKIDPAATKTLIRQAIVYPGKGKVAIKRLLEMIRGQTEPAGKTASASKKLPQELVNKILARMKITKRTFQEELRDMSSHGGDQNAVRLIRENNAAVVPDRPTMAQREAELAARPRQGDLFEDKAGSVVDRIVKRAQTIPPGLVYRMRDAHRALTNDAEPVPQVAAPGYIVPAVGGAAGLGAGAAVALNPNLTSRTVRPHSVFVAHAGTGHRLLSGSGEAIAAANVAEAMQNAGIPSVMLNSHYAGREQESVDDLRKVVGSRSTVPIITPKEFERIAGRVPLEFAGEAGLPFAQLGANPAETLSKPVGVYPQMPYARNLANATNYNINYSPDMGAKAIMPFTKIHNAPRDRAGLLEYLKTHGAPDDVAGKKLITLAAGSTGIGLDAKLTNLAEALKDRNDYFIFASAGPKDASGGPGYNRFVRSTLDKYFPGRHLAVERLNPGDVGRLMSGGDLHIGYGGANSLTESLGYETPTVMGMADNGMNRKNIAWSMKNFKTMAFRDMVMAASRLLDNLDPKIVAQMSMDDLKALLRKNEIYPHSLNSDSVIDAKNFGTASRRGYSKLINRILDSPEPYSARAVARAKRARAILEERNKEFIATAKKVYEEAIRTGKGSRQLLSTKGRLGLGAAMAAGGVGLGGLAYRNWGARPKERPVDATLGARGLMEELGLGIGKKAEDDGSKYLGTEMMVGGAALGVPAYMLDKSLGGVYDKIDRWASVTGKNHNSLLQHPRRMPLASVDNALKDYIAYGREAAQSPLLGTTAGDVMGRIRSAPTDLMRMAGLATKAQSDKIRDHYMLYADPAVTPNRLAGHHMAELGGWERLKQYIDHVRTNPAKPGSSAILTNDVINTLRTSGSIPEALAAIRASGNIHAARLIEASMRSATPAPRDLAGQALADHFKKNKGLPQWFDVTIRGDATPFSGRDPAPHIYERAMRNPANTIRAGSRLAMLAGTGLVIAPVAAAAMHRVHQARNQVKTSQDSSGWKDNAVDVGLGGAGAGLTALGMSKILGSGKPPDSVGVTYGYPEGVGQGHAAPGRAIASTLRRELARDPKFKNVAIDDIIRNSEGHLLEPARRAYDALINTGFGSHASGHELFFDELRSGVMRPRNRGFKAIPDHLSALARGVMKYFSPADRQPKASKYLGYVTDLPEHMGMGAYRPQNPTGPLMAGVFPHNAAALAYGPGQYSNYLSGFKHVYDLGPGLTPALDRKAVTDLLRAYRNKPDIKEVLARLQASGSLSGDLADVASGSSKLLTVSGSGRGDAVAGRAAALQEALERAGLNKEYKVLALMAGAAKGEAGEKLIPALNRRGIATAGFLPSNLFNTAQGASRINWGVTSTSSGAENLMQTNVQAMPGRWDAHTPEPPTPFGMERKFRAEVGAPKWHEPPPLDVWNGGNRQYLLSRPGTLSATSADDIVSLLRDKDRLARLEAQARPRAREEIRNYVKGRRAMVNAVKDSLRRLPGERFRGGAGVAALGTAGLGALLYRNYKKQRGGQELPFVPESNNLVSRIGRRYDEL